MIDKLFLILICGLPFGNFLFKPADLWHGQGHFFQVGLLVIFCLSFFEKPKSVQVLNKPLGILTLWMGLLTSYLWMIIFIKTQHYPIKIFLPFFNWLCFIWFYKLSLEYLDRERIEKIFKWFRYSVILILFYCVLQYLQLDEFLKGLSDQPDQLVGTIGNSSHLAGYLAIVSPLFFNRKGILPLILLWLIIILTKSALGIAIGISLVLIWLMFKKRYLIGSILATISGIGVVGTVLRNPVFFTSSHRLEIWKLSFEAFKHKAITGFGLGSFGLQKFNLKIPASIWRHAHSEPYQIVFEIGLVGLCLILWVMWDYFRDSWSLRKNELCITLLTMFSGFCLFSLFSFPCHLWVIAIIGMISYSWIYVIKNEVINVENSA